MSSLKAQVQNGRLVLNEPTTLPDGDIVELVPLDEVLAGRRRRPRRGRTAAAAPGAS